MSQEEKRPTSEKAPRTRIEDIPRDGEELSEEETSLAAGGVVVCPAQSMILLGPLSPGPTKVANTSTQGTFLGLPAPDSDYGND